MTTERGVRLTVLGLALLALTGAVAPARAEAPSPSPFQTQSFRYSPPERSPKGERRRYVDAAPDAVFAEVWAHLESQGMALQSVDPSTRTVVARFAGDPRTYIDCGSVTLLVNGRPGDPPKTFSAAKAEVRTAKTVNKRRYGLLRQLRLDVRLVARVEPKGKGSYVFTEAIYVATKTTHRLRKGGVPEAMVGREVISFNSETRGQFERGTVCVANGKAEGIPLEPFKKQS
jgi:hypothetical protein